MTVAQADVRAVYAMLDRLREIAPALHDELAPEADAYLTAKGEVMSYLPNVEAVADDGRYNEHFESEAQARAAWVLFNAILRGEDRSRWPRFPGDKPLAPRVAASAATVAGRNAGNDLFREVKARVRVEDFAGRFTELRPAGAGKLKGRCPLHQERTPSFFVYIESQRWQCFGACARGGDVISLGQALVEAGQW